MDELNHILIKLKDYKLNDPKSYPAFYDGESATVIEQVARLRGTMDGIIAEINTFVDDVSKTMVQYTKHTDMKNDHFSRKITDSMNLFIKRVNSLYDEHDKNIKDAIEYMTANIEKLAQDVINTALEEGRINIGTSYNEEEEELTIKGSIE